MGSFRSRAERQARESLRAGIQDLGATSALDFGVKGADGLFVGRIDRHMLRAYKNGMARCFYGLAQAAVSPDGLKFDQGAAGGTYEERCKKAQELQRIWPLGREMQVLLNDYRLQESRGKALAVALAAMSVRLSPSFERRVCLAQALHQEGSFCGADGWMLQALDRSIDPADRARVWIVQCDFYRERGELTHAHAASLAAVACADQDASAWCFSLMTSALVGDLTRLKEAGHGLAGIADCSQDQVQRFRETYGGRYSDRACPAEWLKGLPEVAQQILWVIFS